MKAITMATRLIKIISIDSNSMDISMVSDSIDISMRVITVTIT